MLNVAIISLGCPKNQVDADMLCHSLLLAGYTTTPYLEQADIIIVNTCGFIESAKQEAIDSILEAAEHKKGEKSPKVIVTGCLAERYREEIQKEIPEVDATVGIGCNGGIVEIIKRALEGEKVNAFGEKSALSIDEKRIISTPRHYAYLKISEGCNNRCTYCAIPLIRGNLRSRERESILNEAKWLAGEGVKELIIVAQDVTAYGDDKGKNDISGLLSALNDVEGIEWIRLLYAYPERITDEFVGEMAKNKKVLPYLDLPIQHINTEILTAMNRQGDRDTIVTAIKKLREGVKDITLRTTLIVGFPGETQEQFDELCEFVKETEFDRLGCFAYSEEEGTPAATMAGAIPLEVREARAEQIMQIQANVMAKKQALKQGMTQCVICDGLDEETGLYICRATSDAPEIDACTYIKSESVPIAQGEMLNVLIDDSDVFDLYGHII